MVYAGALQVDDTIVAIGSSTQPAVRGVVRLSGPAAMDVASRLGVAPQKSTAAHQVDGHVDLRQPLGAVPVRALLWPSERSYTGQASAELHTYGSLPILQGLVQRATELGARPARPGEFTLRAFLAGRLDLTQAEAVLGVIEAEQRGSLDQALSQLAGNLSRPMEQLRGELLDLLADVEAGLDFVDEDIQFISDEELNRRLEVIARELETARRQLSLRTRDKSEWMVVLRGWPNAGKSRLLNALAGQEAAIVAEVAGTTRDVVTASAEIRGNQVILVDTAGIESLGGQGIAEQISSRAQAAARRAIHEADVRLWCVDHAAEDWRSAYGEMRRQAEDGRREVADLWVATKADLRTEPAAEPWIDTSTVTRSGLESLRRRIAEAIETIDASESHSVVGTAARCRGSLLAASEAIGAAMRFLAQGEGHEYVSAELRSAADALGEVTGAVYTDDILDRVFSRFCIGK